jgi:hypothetical protein
MDDAGMVYPFLGQDIWGFVHPCTHHPVLGLLSTEGNRRRLAIGRVYYGYNMQLDNNE